MRFRLRDMASIKSKTILICGLLLAPIVLWGQTVFSGCVSDGIQPIFAANIFVSGYHSVGAVTDEAGHFEINIPDSLLADTLVVTSFFLPEAPKFWPHNSVQPRAWLSTLSKLLMPRYNA